MPPAEYVHDRFDRPGRPSLPRPRALDIAVYLLCIGYGLGTLGALIELAAHTGTSEDLVRNLVGSAIGLWLALSMRAGRNWARVILVVLTTVNVLVVVLAAAAVAVAVPPIAPGNAIVVRGAAVLGGALNLAALVCIYQPATRAYFQYLREQR